MQAIDASVVARKDAVFELGRRHALTAYDATYLELAVRLHLPLATFDRALAKAATAAGVEIVQDRRT